MKKRMVFRVLALLLVCALLSPNYAAAAAAVPEEELMPCASDLIDYTQTYIVPKGNGLFEIWYTIQAVDVMDTLGAYQIVLWESDDKVSWTELPTFYQSDIPAMYTSTARIYSYHVSYQGTPGKYYTARVYFRAYLDGELGALAFWTDKTLVN